MASQLCSNLASRFQGKQHARVPRTHALPLSHWHVALSWLDIVTDALAAVSTRQLAIALPSICGMRTSAFFNCCFSIQILLLAGSLAMQVLLAVLQALEEQSSKVMLGDLHPLGPVPIYPDDAPVGPAAAAAGSAAGSTSTASNQHGQVPARASSSASGPGRPKVVGSSRGTASLQDDCCAVLAQPGTLKAVAWAVVRGLTVTELAYQEFGRRALPSASRTAAVMHIRLSELVFEGPQVVISWMVLLGRLTIEELARASGVTTLHVDETTKVLQWVSLIIGVLSLSVGCTDFMRLHGRSFWAGPPPSVLFLGLLDVSKNTWKRSTLIGGHALFSLFTRAFLYIMASSMTLILAFFDVRHNRSTAAAARAAGHALESWPTVALQVVFPGMLLTSLACNIALLRPMRDWILFPASMISCFVNIPWIAAPADSPSYGTLHSLIPAVLLQLLCAGAAFALACVSLRPIPFMSPCNYAPAKLTWLGSPVQGLGSSVMTLLLPVLVASAEIFLFCTLAMVVNRERTAAAASQGAGQPSQPPQPPPQPQQHQLQQQLFPPGPPQATQPGQQPAPNSGSMVQPQRHNTGAPALAYKFVLWKRPFLFCAVRVTGHPLLPTTTV